MGMNEADDCAAHRSVRRWLALGLYLTYFFTSSGGFEVSDASLRYLTAVSWIEGRGGALPPELGWNGGVVAPDGRVYVWFGPLQSVLMVPFVLGARALPATNLDRSVVETFAICLGLFPLLSTAVIILLHTALGLLGFRPRPALLACLAVALASLFWHYARMGQEENLVACGFALWLLGAARLAAGRRLPAILMAAGALTALATRWATTPLLAVLGVCSLVLLLRHRSRAQASDLAAAGLLLAAGVSALLLYNQARFGDPLETGYGLWFARHGLTMFQLDGYGGRLAALLASPYRGLLFYSPIAFAALAGVARLERGDQRIVGLGGLAVLAASLALHAAFRFWTGGHSWGPRFLASSQVLLVPLFAALFTRRPRLAFIVPLLACLQVFSTMLPASTEEYVWFNVDRTRTGHCNPWRFECTPVPQRIPRALCALANTVGNRPGQVVSGRPIVAPEVVLETSDYRTLYWWPVRIAFRLRRIPLAGALGLVLAGLAAAAYSLSRAWSRSVVTTGGS